MMGCPSGGSLGCWMMGCWMGCWLGCWMGCWLGCWIVGCWFGWGVVGGWFAGSCDGITGTDAREVEEELLLFK